MRVHVEDGASGEAGVVGVGCSGGSVGPGLGGLGWRLGGWKPEAGSWKLKAGDWGLRPEAGAGGYEIEH